MLMRQMTGLIVLFTCGILLSSDGQPPLAEQVRAHLTRDEWQQALALARRDQADSDDRADTAAALGESLFRAGQLEEVAGVLEPLLESEDVPARALITLARLYHARGRHDEVEGLLDAAVAGAPADAELLYLAGDLAAGRARTIALLNRYLELSGDVATPRTESARGMIRFLTQLGDRALWTAVKSPRRLELPLTMLWDSSGHALGYVIEARVGEKGKRVRLLLDTGTSGLTVIDRIARKRGFEPLVAKTLFGGGGSGVHETLQGVFPQFALGELRFENALATSTRQELEPTGRYHGLIGLNIFDGYRVTLDLLKKRLILEADRVPSGGDPYWWIAGQLLVRVRTTDDTSGLFILDTGAAMSVLADSFVDHLQVDSPGQTVKLRAFGGLVEGAKVVRGVEIDYQGFKTGRAGLIVTDMTLPSRLGGVEVSGLLGLDLLAGKRLILDTTTRQIELVGQP
jgi:tetratricopeptide (TPR) repeat protein